MRVYTRLMFTLCCTRLSAFPYNFKYYYYTMLSFVDISRSAFTTTTTTSLRTHCSTTHIDLPYNTDCCVLCGRTLPRVRISYVNVCGKCAYRRHIAKRVKITAFCSRADRNVIHIVVYRDDDSITDAVFRPCVQSIGKEKKTYRYIRVGIYVFFRSQNTLSSVVLYKGRTKAVVRPIKERREKTDGYTFRTLAETLYVYRRERRAEPCHVYIAPLDEYISRYTRVCARVCA